MENIQHDKNELFNTDALISSKGQKWGIEYNQIQSVGSREGTKVPTEDVLHYVIG